MRGDSYIGGTLFCKKVGVFKAAHEFQPSRPKMTEQFSKAKLMRAVIRLGLVCSALALAGCTTGRTGSTTANYAAPSSTIKVCSGYGCIITDKFAFSPDEQAQLVEIMQAGYSAPESERQAIGTAIAAMERMARSHNRYRPDIEFSYQKNAGKRGQMDCVDESLNTTSYLNYLYTQKLLRFHKPINTYAERGLLLDGRYPHKSARMKDNKGVAWAVDSWKGPDGTRPEIMPLSRWYRDRNSVSNY